MAFNYPYNVSNYLVLNHPCTSKELRKDKVLYDKDFKKWNEHNRLGVEYASIIAQVED